MNVDELIPKVIEAMEVNRQVRPTVYAEMAGGQVQVFPLFSFIGDARTKAHLLFLEGRRAGQRLADRELAEGVLVTEVWLTKDQRNPTPGMKPPAHIEQKEGVMLASSKNSEPFQTTVKIYEIKRDKSGKAKELQFFNESVDPVGLMGLAFIAGWHSREMSEEEVRAMQPRGMRAFLQV